MAFIMVCRQEEYQYFKHVVGFGVPYLLVGNRIGYFWVVLCLFFESESWCTTFQMKMSFHSHANKTRFMWKVLHQASFWERGTRQLGNGLSCHDNCLLNTLCSSRVSNRGYTVLGKVRLEARKAHVRATGKSFLWAPRASSCASPNT